MNKYPYYKSVNSSFKLQHLLKYKHKVLEMFGTLQFTLVALFFIVVSLLGPLLSLLSLCPSWCVLAWPDSMPISGFLHLGLNLNLDLNLNLYFNL